MSTRSSPVGGQEPEWAGQAAGTSGACALFTEPVLVVNQRDKLVELSNEYDVRDRHGVRIGTVVQVGQGRFAKAVRLLGKSDHFKTVQLEVRDVHEVPVLRMTRPAKIVRSRVLVQRPDGTGLGEIRQDNAFGRIRFSVLVGRQRVGAITATNWRTREFTITDHDGSEIARIVQTWEGLAKAVFSTADTYVVQIERQQPEPWASLIVASALAVDTALKQDAR